MKRRSWIRRLATLLLLVGTIGAMAQKKDDDIDKAFGAQKKATQSQGTTDASVKSQVADTKSRVQERASEREQARAEAIQQRMAAQDDAKQTCRSGANCYTVENSNASTIHVRCNAGFKRGDSQTIWRGKSAGCYKTSAMSGSCDTLHKTALLLCSLD